ncbi:MAG: 4-(cytidine 5'-diphospho)-2-C-methyl-D-erythritol kinase [Lachnospiraceae bacterium]|nr:4-(cytidine 5'-diphospho)-2-C-methyl-D-erythritol kinase [Lachnospiraceae bacterium]
MDQITLKAMAKVNLGLDVVRRMENGYHEVRMIMQTVDLYDELTFEKAEEGISLRIDNTELLADESNLVYRAAAMIRQQHPFPGVRITLKKKIPMAAGMAGGSSDAAAAFHGLNRLFSLGMEIEEMKRLGVQIGADVPYCIVGGTMRSEGIGEVLTPLPAPPAAYLVIAKPDISVSTKYVYENLHVETIRHHPDIDSVEAAIRAGDLDGMCNHMENILETVTERKYPVIAQLKELLRGSGAVTALMSGSGPTVFGIFRTEQDAQAAYEKAEQSGLAKQLFVTTFSDATCIE